MPAIWREGARDQQALERELVDSRHASAGRARAAVQLTAGSAFAEVVRLDEIVIALVLRALVR